MPIRRSGDTTKVDDPTAREGAASAEDSDSLFEPLTVALPTDHSAAPADSAPSEDDQATRVVGPVRRTTQAAAEQQAANPMADPPVGWLVVVRGPGKGHVLALGNGLNVIGRAPDMRVCIDFGDNNISRSNHARIVYEPRERRFLLLHGDGTNLTYLNNQLVIDAVDLASGSEVQIGNTTLRFQALCGKDFDWSELDG